MVLKYYIDNEEVSENDYYDIIFGYIVKEVASEAMNDVIQNSHFTFEDMCEDDGVQYEAEGRDEDAYFVQLYEVKNYGKSEVMFYGKTFKILGEQQ